MRIGVNTLFLIPSEVGGAETYLRQTLRAMAEQLPAGDRLVVFTNAENDAALRRDLAGCEAAEFVPLGFRASNRTSRILREQLVLPLRVRRAGADVLWSPGYTSPLRCPCPCVTSILDLQYRSHPEDFPLMARLATRTLVAGSVRRSRLLIAISEFSKAELEKGFGLKPEFIRVTPLACDPVFFDVPPAGECGVARAGLGVERPYLLVVANTYPHKRVEKAVEAWALLAEECPHHLVLVGRPRLGEAEVQRSVAAARRRDRVRRLEYVSWSELAALYRGAAAFVFPSVYEGFGLPVLEAMAAGAPVITTRSASIPEVGGDAVVYAEPDPHALAAGLRTVLSRTPAEREAAALRARERAASFSWRRTAAETLSALREAGCAM